MIVIMTTTRTEQVSQQQQQTAVVPPTQTTTESVGIRLRIYFGDCDKSAISVSSVQFSQVAHIQVGNGCSGEHCLSKSDHRGGTNTEEHTKKGQIHKHTYTQTLTF